MLNINYVFWYKNKIGIGKWDWSVWLLSDIYIAGIYRLNNIFLHPFDSCLSSQKIGQGKHVLPAIRSQHSAYRKGYWRFLVRREGHRAYSELKMFSGSSYRYPSRGCPGYSRGPLSCRDNQISRDWVVKTVSSLTTRSRTTFRGNVIRLATLTTRKYFEFQHHLKQLSSKRALQ